MGLPTSLSSGIVLFSITVVADNTTFNLKFADYTHNKPEKIARTPQLKRLHEELAKGTAIYE